MSLSAIAPKTRSGASPVSATNRRSARAPSGLWHPSRRIVRSLRRNRSRRPGQRTDATPRAIASGAIADPRSSAARTAVAALAAWCAPSSGVASSCARRAFRAGTAWIRATARPPRGGALVTASWSFAPVRSAAARNTRSASGRRLATSAGRPAPEDAGLLRGDGLDRGAQILDVVERDRRHDRDGSGSDVRRVEPASQSDLEDRQIERPPGENPERRGGHRLEVGQRHLPARGPPRRRPRREPRRAPPPRRRSGPMRTAR